MIHDAHSLLVAHIFDFGFRVFVFLRFFKRIFPSVFVFFFFFSRDVSQTVTSTVMERWLFHPFSPIPPVFSFCYHLSGHIEVSPFP